MSETGYASPSNDTHLHGSFQIQLPDSSLAPKVRHVNFNARHGFQHSELRQWALWVAGVVAAQFSAIKRKQNVSRSKARRGFFDSNHRSCRRLFFGRNCRWLSLLYGPAGLPDVAWNCTSRPPQPSPCPHNHTRLFTCCLAGFYGAGIVWLSAAVCSSSCKKKTPRRCTQCTRDQAGKKRGSLFKA